MDSPVASKLFKFNSDGRLKDSDLIIASSRSDGTSTSPKVKFPIPVLLKAAMMTILATENKHNYCIPIKIQ